MFSMFQWLRFRPQGLGLRVQVLGSRPFCILATEGGQFQGNLAFGLYAAIPQKAL